VAQAAGEQLLGQDRSHPGPGDSSSVITTTTSSSSTHTRSASHSQGSSDRVDVETADGRWGIPPFFVVRGPQGAAAPQSSGGPRFNFQAPTTCRNAFRLLRAMQVRGVCVCVEISCVCVWGG
jgi:hypothetical protein